MGCDGNIWTWEYKKNGEAQLAPLWPFSRRPFIAPSSEEVWCPRLEEGRDELGIG